MKKNFSLLLISIVSISCLAQKKSIIRDNVFIDISTYEEGNKSKADAMPMLKPNSELMPFKKRFDYLLINLSAIHSPHKAQERNEVWKLYPDTLTLSTLYLNKFVEDKKLVRYFEETAKYSKDSTLKRKTQFTQDELMEVASKFFYCDEVLPDSSIQAHICVGLNGIAEAKWKKDFVLLEAFCYEGIFTEFDNEPSRIWDIFVAEKKNSTEKFFTTMTSLDQYLLEVKLELFERMKNNSTLKKELLAYYALNKHNLAFEIIQ